jgi:3-deoxy-manno-octulosonate cytidylyltransferase (CMP-KDO synthetase)
MKIVAIIPSRGTATRYGAAKALAKILDKPMIEWVHRWAKEADVLGEVVVATDSKDIYECVEGFGGRVEMTDSEHRSGSDRVAEAARILGLEDDDIVVNIQGDQPAFYPQHLSEVVSPLKADPELVMTTLIYKITKPEEITDPYHVKCVFDEEHFALYFSRSTIPFDRDKTDSVDYFKHLGIYAYRNHFLQHFASLPTGTLEQIEKLEHLRVMELEPDRRIKVIETLYDSIEVDKPEDIPKAEAGLRARLEID